jgi:hypothetical protein
MDGELEPVDTTHWCPKVIRQGLYGRNEYHREPS